MSQNRTALPRSDMSTNPGSTFSFNCLTFATIFSPSTISSILSSSSDIVCPSLSRNYYFDLLLCFFLLERLQFLCEEITRHFVVCRLDRRHFVGHLRFIPRIPAAVRIHLIFTSSPLRQHVNSVVFLQPEAPNDPHG